MFGISRQAFYKQRKAHNNQVSEQVIIHTAVTAIRSRQPRLGGRKLHYLLTDILAAHKIAIGRDKLFNFLSANNLLVRRRKRIGPKTTDSSAWMRQYPDLLKGATITQINQFWVSDITYLEQGKDFVYLALITDVHSRMVVGYNVSKSLSAESLCLPALEMALKNVPIQHRLNLVHHSDRGTQYLSGVYCNKLGSENARISMTQSGDPRDNAIAERLNGILKQELLPASFTSFNQAEELIKEAIYVYNSLRPHTSLKLNTPMEKYINAIQTM